MNRSDQVARADARERAEIPYHFPEYRVRPIQVGLRREGNEPLAGPGIGARQGHSQHRLCPVAAAVDLVPYGAAGPAETITPRIAILHHKVRHHPMPSVAVE